MNKDVRNDNLKEQSKKKKDFILKVWDEEPGFEGFLKYH